MIVRRETRKVTVGDSRVGFVSIGGDAPVSVQTMTAGYTYEIDKCVAEIQKLAAAGPAVGRVAGAGEKDTPPLKESFAPGTLPHAPRPKSNTPHTTPKP